ncbi:MAG: hypothetical protein QOJ70_113 [Acidobacteriota bacterium]|jgi:hypothetical protein|nr:hypothetical protein [Acidobacteriota bacterium]MDT7806300.1 hypothetical protein [Acidobacteriota bacterium]
MLNLRVYTNGVSSSAPNAERVFYCQRAGGPHYRWCDERGLGQWHFTRLHPAEWNPRILFHLNEKDMPSTLQARLAEHYMW